MSNKIAKDIKAKLIELAVNDELPTDLNTLDEKVLESVIKETRVYAIDPDDERVADIGSITDLTDEEFIFEAEEQGLVWSLKGFEIQFNYGSASDQWIIRII